MRPTILHPCPWIISVQGESRSQHSVVTHPSTNQAHA